MKFLFLNIDIFGKKKKKKRKKELTLAAVSDRDWSAFASLLDSSQDLGVDLDYKKKKKKKSKKVT
jgi:hypothetical protein